MMATSQRHGCAHQLHESGAASDFRRGRHANLHFHELEDTPTLDSRVSTLEAEIKLLRARHDVDLETVRQAILTEVKSAGGIDPVEFAFRTKRPLSLVGEVVEEFQEKGWLGG